MSKASVTFTVNLTPTFTMSSIIILMMIILPYDMMLLSLKPSSSDVSHRLPHYYSHNARD